MNIHNRDELLPLTPQTAGIILALADKPQYGYAISQMVLHDSQALLKIRSGSLYPTLQHLKAAGYIEDAGLEKSTSSPFKRKMYQLTDRGHELLRLEMERQADFAALARKRLSKES